MELQVLFLQERLITSINGEEAHQTYQMVQQEQAQLYQEQIQQH